MPSPVIDLPYTAPLSLDQARTAIQAAQSEAAANGWNVAVAVVDCGGHLVAFERMPKTQFASSDIAIAKARTAAGFRRPSKALQDALAANGEALRTLVMPGALPIDGGVPIVVGNGIAGAIGVSGVLSEQDGQIARAGAGAVD
jgi:uncharacterized protein GlcG (DUF336 family)